MNPTPELIKQLRREKIEAARRMSGEEKLRAGAELFTYACEITKAGIRAQFPEADEDEVLQILRDRLELAARREERRLNGTA